MGVLEHESIARPPPARFDDYEVIGPLGAGGMGTVYRGRDRFLDRPVALKFMATGDDAPQLRERFVGEARAIARLHHPNVVAIYRIGEVEGQSYLAYELVAGPSLVELARPVPSRRALTIALGIARGLAATHARGVLHRDIKPANVILGDGDVPKLIDFGLAKLVGESSDDSLVGDVPAVGVSTLRTSRGAVVGTPAYMAPELWMGTPASAQSDIFAFGLVIWELIAGDLPYPEASAPEMAAAIIHRGVPGLASVAPDVLAPLAVLVDRCVARDPAARPASIEVVRDELELLHGVYASLNRPGLEGLAPGDRELITASFGRIAADADGFASRFYARMFEIAPEVRLLFPVDLTHLRRKLMATLDTVVRNLGTPEHVIPMLEELGARHRGYRVTPDHFAPVGRAMLATLALDEGPRWTPELARAWAWGYERIAAHMARGMAAASGSFPAVRPPPEPEVPAPCYLQAGDVSLAYQVFGRPGRDLVFLPAWLSHLELAWQGTELSAFLRGLGKLARVVVFDKRGTGLSDRETADLGLDTRLADLLAVMDAAGVERGVVVGCSDSAAVAAVLAATHPERVRALVLYGLGAAALGRPETGLDPDVVQRQWGTPLFIDSLAPSHRADERFRTWWARYLRSSATPSSAAALLRSAGRLDIAAVLPTIRVPTVFLHRRGDRVAPIETARAAAALVPGAELVELDGDDHLAFAGDPAGLLSALGTFLRAMPTMAVAPIQLVTVLVLRAEDPARLAPAIIAARGLVAPSPPGLLVALFDVTPAALRVARRLAEDARFAAGLDVGVTPTIGDDSDVLATACSLAYVATVGHIRLSARARAFLWEESGPSTGDELELDLIAGRSSRAFE